jgi:predicted DNA-binding protein
MPRGSVHYNFRLPLEHLEFLRSRAKNTESTVSDLIREAITCHYELDKPNGSLVIDDTPPWLR